MGSQSIDKAAHEVRRALIEAGQVEPLSQLGADRRRWWCFDLASIAELCFEEILDPDNIDQPAWTAWLERMGPDFELPSWERIEDAPDATLGSRYWLLSKGERVGTVQLSDTPSDWGALYLLCLFVLPHARGRGVASGVLQAAASEMSKRSGAGLRLDTSWLWQKNVRFYLQRGFRVYDWKRSIGFILNPQAPKWTFEVSDEEARFLVSNEPLWIARRKGDRLELEQGKEPEQKDPYALSTFAVLLALEGWPLVCDESSWIHRHASADAGHPAGLAEKIGLFEEFATEAGWVIATPEIPGRRAWVAWSHGENYGERQAILRMTKAVCFARKLPINEDQWQFLERLHPALMEDFLRQAATSENDPGWTQTLQRFIEQAEQIE